jgi:hypothetical protein
MAMMMPISASPVIRPAENSVPGRCTRSRSSSSCGATPWTQQLMLAIGAFSCALVMAPVLYLLA